MRLIVLRRLLLQHNVRRDRRYLLEQRIDHRPRRMTILPFLRMVVTVSLVSKREYLPIQDPSL